MPPATPFPPDPSADAPPPPAARGGYTLPVWVAAAARAAVGALVGEPFAGTRALELLGPGGPTPVPVRAAALLDDGWALGESACEPGDALDLTRGLVVWVLARWGEGSQEGGGGEAPWMALEAGEGVGILAATGEVCASAYARRLLETNLRALVPAGRCLRLRVVLPNGRELATRTSNAAFGVVEGLALIGTRAEPRAGADPDLLRESLGTLRRLATAEDFGGDAVLVIGANGFDLASRLGVPPSLVVRAGNWLGPLLVAAAQEGVRRLLLFGYQGKLLKLAGGIFHTHHHLADGRAEVLTALAALEGLAGTGLERLHEAPTVEQALQELEARDPALAERLRRRVALEIERRSLLYLERHGAPAMAVGAVLFDRARRIRVRGPVGGVLLEALGGGP